LTSSGLLVPASLALQGLAGSSTLARRACDFPRSCYTPFPYVVVRLMLEALIVRGRSEARLRAEVLALRHQLGVLERQVGRSHRQSTDRLVLAAISRVLPRPDWRSLVPRPETLLRGHQELVQRKWAAYRHRPRRGRPNARSELHDLILKLARENEGWGYRRMLAS
jgi:putative transposase